MASKPHSGADREVLLVETRNAEDWAYHIELLDEKISELEEQLQTAERDRDEWKERSILTHAEDSRLLEQVQTTERQRDLLQREADAAKVTITELELACDHHRMFWQKAEERERGLKEQLESAERTLAHAEEFIASQDMSYRWSEWCEGRDPNLKSPVLNPASSPPDLAKIARGFVGPQSAPVGVPLRDGGTEAAGLNAAAAGAEALGESERAAQSPASERLS